MAAPSKPAQWTLVRRQRAAPATAVSAGGSSSTRHLLLPPQLQPPHPSSLRNLQEQDRPVGVGSRRSEALASGVPADAASKSPSRPAPGSEERWRQLSGRRHLPPGPLHLPSFAVSQTLSGLVLGMVPF